MKLALRLPTPTSSPENADASSPSPVRANRNNPQKLYNLITKALTLGAPTPPSAYITRQGELKTSAKKTSTDIISTDTFVDNNMKTAKATLSKLENKCQKLETDLNEFDERMKEWQAKEDSLRRSA